MQISQPQDAPTLICRSRLPRHQDAPTEPMGVSVVGWTPGCPVPLPSAEELAWSAAGGDEARCDAPTEEIDPAQLKRLMARAPRARAPRTHAPRAHEPRRLESDEPWFRAPVATSWEPQIRARSRFESAARAALLLAAAWLPAAALLLAS